MKTMNKYSTRELKLIERINAIENSPEAHTPEKLKKICHLEEKLSYKFLMKGYYEEVEKVYNSIYKKYKVLYAEDMSKMAYLYCRYAELYFRSVDFEKSEHYYDKLLKLYCRYAKACPSKRGNCI